MKNNEKGVPLFLFSLAIALLLLSSTASAQVVTGEMTGLVTDQSGAAVPKASITAECPATKERRVATTADNGEYRISQMSVCVYKVSATAPGFKTVLRDVRVSIALETKADFQLQIGQRAETITVESAAPLIEYTDQLNNYVDQDRIVDLPFNGRDFNSMLGVMPGVQRAPGGGFIAVSINGARTTSNNYLIDGMYNNDRYYGDSAIGQTGVLGIPATLLPNDAIAEFTVQQLPSAEYGVKGGASINVSLKSGTNAIHGDVYYFGHADFTDAANGITKTVTPLHNHQYGADIGGPIIKDKLFYYGFFEGQRNKSLTPYQLAVPPQADITTAQANAYAISGIAPGINGAGLPGQALMNFFTTDPTGSHLFGVPNSDVMSEFLVKLDYKLSDKHQISGKYFFGDSFQSAPSAGYTLAPRPGSSLGPDGFNSIAPSRAQLVGASWTYTISPNKILVSRFGMTRFSQIIDVNNKIDPRSLGVDTGPLVPGDFGVPYVYLGYISYAGYNGAPLGYIGGVAGYPITTRPDQTYDIAENFTLIKGSHTMKMGGNWQYAYTNSLRNRARSNLQIFNDSSSPGGANCCINALTQLLLLRFDQASRIFGSTQRRITQSSFGLFFTDEWKIRPRVTITLGLRWDLNTPLTDVDLQGGNFIPPPPGKSGPIPPGTGLLNLGIGGIDHIYNYDFHNFGPRAGVAWDVFGNGKTALRVGYALTYDVATLATIHAPQNSSMNGSRSGVFTDPNQNVFSVQANGVFASSISAANLNNCYDPVANPNAAWVCGATYAGGVATRSPLYGANPATTAFNIYSILRDLKTPRIHNVQTTIQQQVAKNNVVTISYVGSFGQDLYMIRDLNARPIGCWRTGFAVPNADPLSNGQSAQLTGPPNSARNPTSLDCRRPYEQQFPTFKTIGQLTNDSKSYYHSLQASFRQQSWHGLNTQYSFTWSHCIDWSSANRGSFRSGFTPKQNPYDPSFNQANCDHDVRLNFNLGGTYTFPKINSWGRWGEGWEIGSVFTALSGRPFTAENSSRDRSGQDVNGVVRANCLAKPIYDTRNPGNYITNRAVAFQQPGGGTVGTCGRNSLIGPGLAQLDMNFVKTTKITEWLKVQFRWEIFNILDRLNFAQTVNQNARSGSFGNSSTTPDSLNPGLAQGGPRVMQFALKFTF